MLIQIVSVSDDNDKLREVAVKHCDVLLLCGFTKPLATLKQQDVPLIIESVSLHTTILQVSLCNEFNYNIIICSKMQVKAELDEIKKGLADSGVLEFIQKYPEFFRCLFVWNRDILTAGQNEVKRIQLHL